MFATYDITFLIYFDISFDFETDEDKKEKKVYLFQEEKKEKKKRKRKRKKVDMRPPGIEPERTDSESDVLTILLLRRLK